MEQSYVAEDILMVGATTCTLYQLKLFLDIFLNIIPKPFIPLDSVIFVPGYNLFCLFRLIQAPMRLNFSRWRPNPEN